MLTCFQFINFKIVNLTLSLYIFSKFFAAQFFCPLPLGVKTTEIRLNENYFDTFVERILRCFLSAAIILLGKESKNNGFISKFFSKICHPLCQDILDVTNSIAVNDSFCIYKNMFFPMHAKNPSHFFLDHHKLN